MDDFAYYSQHHLKIRDKQGELQPFGMNFAQRLVHGKLSKQLRDTGRIRCIVLKARQEGISTYVAGRFFRRCHLRSLQRGAVIADANKKSETIFEIYERFYNNLITEMRPDRVRYDSGQQLVLEHDSQLIVDTAGNKEALRGSTPQLLHASELAFWPNGEDTWTAIAPAIPKKGSEVIIESTANGVGNFFHHMWTQAEEGINGYLPIFLPWWIHEEYEMEVTEDQRKQILESRDPFERKAQDEGFKWEGRFHKLSVEKLAWRRWIGIPEQAANDPRKFQQEFPTTAQEAFLQSGSGFFDTDRLIVLTEKAKKPVMRGRLVEERGTIKISPVEMGWLRIWNLPGELVCKNSHLDDKCGPLMQKVKQHDRWMCANCLQPLVPGLYVIGADTASGRKVSNRSFDDAHNERGGRDFSCADVFEVHTRRQVAQLHGGMYPEEFARQLNWLGYLYGSEAHGRRFPALLAVERNHESGHTVLRKLQRDFEYPNLYRSRQINTARNAVTPIIGWVTDKRTRMPMLDELAESVRDGSITIHSADTIREMQTFVQLEDGKPQAQEGTHDDRVISLGICLQIARTKNHEPTVTELPDIEYLDSPTGIMDYGY